MEYPELSNGGQIVQFGCQFDMPRFIVSERIVNGKIMSITAYDCCKNLDVPFDYSSYTQFDENGKAKWYHATVIYNDIANQCGFSGESGHVWTAASWLCYNDIAGKSCRQILEEAAKAECGFWYCGPTNLLTFQPFTPSGTEHKICGENRSKIKLSGKKTITGIIAEDELYGTVFSSGTAWENTERLSGRYMTSEVARSVSDKILAEGSYTHYGWSCEALAVDFMAQLLDRVVYTDGSGSEIKLPVLTAAYRFGAKMITASMSADTPDTSFTEYHDLYSRQIAGTLKLDRSYGCVRLNNDGMKFIYRNENSSEEYGFTTDTGGMTTYSGVMNDGVMPSKIIKSGDNERTVMYGDTKYRLTWDKAEDGSKTNIRYEKAVE